ncbi:gene transfer agent family protein [Ancylobacter radicis]|uniref:Gene transfer agent family protein n=1 Tax=Ancylobacter radicis TaxID=2836179 RepID=A0ABS5R4V6_9HYPH|nr:gene transfer agent family protein [Ancylobacter radicis]MBS9476240.1 gene transfer agent family protein [Ancylobacter radicis]
MARDARVELDWAGGLNSFRLGWGELARLQEACDAGPFVVLNRLQAGMWRVEDISSVIRFGLIGGGLDPAKAMKLTRDYVEARPPMETLLLAEAILSAACFGVSDEMLGKAKAADQGSVSTTSRTESSGSPPSTEPEPS